MIRKAKWVDGAESGQRVSEVAREVLRARLDLVRRYLDLAACKPEENIEYVHQLRVGTRRAIAALETFDPLLPKRKRRITRRLRGIIKAAGPARDDDVLIIRLQAMASAEPDGGTQYLLEQTLCHRDQVQKTLVAKRDQMKRKRFQQDVATLIEKVRWRAEGTEPTFASFARQCLPGLLTQFYAAADTDLADARALHQLRILGKRLRYAMELFVAVFPPEFRTVLYPEIEQLQELLGTVNDHATALARFERELEEAQHDQAASALRMIIDQETAGLESSRSEFAQWWTSQRIEQHRTSFTEMLAE